MFGGARILLNLACVLYMPIGDALTIVFTEPLWTLALSKLLLKVKIGAWKVAFGLLLIFGTLLCIQPPFLFPTYPFGDDKNTTDSLNERDDGDDDDGGGYYIGVMLALSCALCGAMANVSMAKCEKVSSKVLMFYSGLGGLLLSLLVSALDPAADLLLTLASIPGTTWMLLTVLGVMGILGCFSMSASLRLIPPTTVAMLRALEIIMAYIAQVATCYNYNVLVFSLFKLNILGICDGRDTQHYRRMWFILGDCQCYCFCNGGNSASKKS